VVAEGGIDLITVYSYSFISFQEIVGEIDMNYLIGNIILNSFLFMYFDYVFKIYIFWNFLFAQFNNEVLFL
jgi:hypothetical protein